MSARAVERDYVLAHVVAAVAISKVAANLIFKGGTALRMCHFKDFRYSADLDFSIIGGTIPAGLRAVREALENVAGTVSQLKLTEDDPPRVAYVGPLDRQRTLKLDIADDQYVVNTEHRSLFLRWPDLPKAAKVHVYTPAEIAAEKLRCVLQRLQCRDLFDLYMLFNEAGVDAREAAALYEPKAKHRGFEPGSFSARYSERLVQYEKRWDAELGDHCRRWCRISKRSSGKLLLRGISSAQDAQVALKLSRDPRPDVEVGTSSPMQLTASRFLASKHLQKIELRAKPPIARTHCWSTRITRMPQPSRPSFAWEWPFGERLETEGDSNKNLELVRVVGI